MNKLNTFGIWAFLLFLPITVTAQNRSIPEIPAHASISFHVVNLETGNDVLDVTADRLLTSASLMKMVTTATALGELGPDFTFSTKLWMTGRLHDHILEGDLILEGGGDPTLGSGHFPSQSADRILQKISGFL